MEKSPLQKLPTEVRVKIYAEAFRGAKIDIYVDEEHVYESYHGPFIVL